MRVVIDVEADGLYPSKLWVVVCRDVDTDEVHVFDQPWKDYTELIAFLKNVKVFIGHNIIDYDSQHVNRLTGTTVFDPRRCIDTLVVSRLIDYSRKGGHSLESYGEEFGVKKPEQDQWEFYEPNMVHRCTQDTLINLKVYHKYLKYIESPKWKDSLRLEHEIAYYCTILNKNGFYFNTKEALELREILDKEVHSLEAELHQVFPPRFVFLKEVSPKLTKFGTLSKSDFRFIKDGDLSEYNGGPFSRLEIETFNPGSPIQRIDRLWGAGWRPITKTKGHKEFEKNIQSLKKELSPEEFEKKSSRFQRYGWTVDEENLATLPKDAPEAVRKLARWLLVISRVRRLDEWLPLVSPSNRIHGAFNHIGAWTHRMSHQAPNMGNIPKFDDKQPDKTPYSDKLRALWGAPPGRLLVGVDAESIQLRVLAHYLDDKEFTASLVSGDKANGTDPHSVNMRALGEVCKSRDDAKTWVYAWLLGSGRAKGAAVLGCSLQEYDEAITNLLDRFENLRYLKDKKIRDDAERGYFQGFDGRYVKARGADARSREHYMLGGYLQNGESTIMKRALCLWYPRLVKEGIDFLFVNLVHDEYQTEVPHDYELAKYVAQVQADAIRQVGEDLKLRCPMAGSYLSDHGTLIDGQRLAIGTNWLETH